MRASAHLLTWPRELEGDVRVYVSVWDAQWVGSCLAILRSPSLEGVHRYAAVVEWLSEVPGQAASST